MPYGHIIAVCHTDINILRGKNAELANVKLGGKLTTGPYLVHNGLHTTD